MPQKTLYKNLVLFFIYKWVQWHEQCVEKISVYSEKSENLPYSCLTSRDVVEYEMVLRISKSCAVKICSILWN